MHDPDPRRHRRLWRISTEIVLAISAVFFVAAAILFACSAQAHMKDRPDLDAWFNGLQSSGGYPCCSFVDGTTIADIDWDTTVVNGESRYQVRIDHNWITVSPEEVVTGPNKFGRAVAWIYKDGMGVTNIRCFMPGSQG